MKKLRVLFLQTLPLCFALLGTTQLASAASDLWTGTAGPNWNNANNWTGGNAPPVTGDSLVFGSSTPTTLNNNLAALTAFGGLTFSGGSAFTLNGNAILLSGSPSNTIGVANSSGLAQAIGTMPLTLDQGYYTFSSPSGGSVALNGGLTLNPGGVACFDNNVTSTSLTADGTTGLIAGLEGAGLMYDGAITPTGLAAISGGVITAYSAYTTLSPPAALATGAGSNIELNTPAGNSGAYTANGISVNTIRSTQAGNSAGTLTDTLTNTGTLTFGDKGGVYVLDAGAGNKACVNLTNGLITAGTAGPATLIFAVNGTTTGNQLAVNSKITNNAAGGAVTVITTGRGSLFFAVTNSYTGGTYVNQGQLQGNNVGAFGSGPIYIAGGASALLNQAGTWANKIFLSPGSGAPIGGAGTVNGEGALELNNNDTFTGGLTLQGAPVTAPPGDRITPNITGGTETFSSQITGTGTLEFYGFHSYTAVLSNTSLVNTNNWQGGMIIGGKPGVAVNVLVKMGAANQIPSGPNAGDIIFLPAAASGNANARLDLNGFNTTVNGLVAISANSQAEAQLLNQGSTNCALTLGANNATAQFNGTVSDGGIGKATTLNKIGSGTQTFNNTMTHFGNTIVSAGTLALTGSANPTNSPSISVASGAILDGSGLFTGGLVVGGAQTLAGLGTVVGPTTISGTVSPFLGAIGTLANNGPLTFNGGGSYVWDINNATGAAGTDSGWGLLNITGGNLAIVATSGNPINIKITSLAAGDAPGNAANFNSANSYNWTLARADSPITGFDPSVFHLDTSAFSNLPGSTAFSIQLSTDQKSLVLAFSPVVPVCNPLVNQSNCPGSTAQFTVGVCPAARPGTYQWLFNANPINNGDFRGSGSTFSISSSGSGSTLTLTNVQDADAGGYSVIVTGSVGTVQYSSAALSVIDPPSNPVVVQSPSPIVSAGGVAYFTVTADGTAPFTYAWSRNGVPLANGGHISGANSATLAVDVSTADEGSYTVMVANACGSPTSSPSVLGAVTTVPSQIIYEPFSSYAPQVFRPSFTTWEGVTNLFNQATGEPAWWYHASGSGIQMIVQANDIGDGVNNQNGGSYPWPGLAGNSTNCLYWSESLNSHLQFAQSGFPTGTTVYVSFILTCTGLGAVNGVQDCIAAFCSPNDSTSYNWKLCTQINDSGAGNYLLGLSKANGKTGSQGVDANTTWASTPTLNNQAVLVVGCYTVNSGGTTATDDTVSLWLNPDSSTFGAGSAPAPTIGPSSFDVANSAIRDFSVHSVVAPSSHRIADLRIGTTWASVTPPARPTLTLANVSVDLGATAVFASQNAGNPADTYQWQFNGGPVLSDNGHITGSATATLTITGVQAADLGTYTVTGGNTDPLYFTNLTGTASATLTINPPRLRLTSSAPNVIISWPTNWVGYILERTPSVAPASWVTNSLPPYPLDNTHTNYGVSVSAGSAAQFFRLKK